MEAKRFRGVTKANAASSRASLRLLLAYLLLAVILTWPMAAQLASHLPGDGGDDPAIAWNLWWVRYALLNLGQSPFVTDYMFYPIGLNLTFYTLTVLNAVTALPLTLNLGVVTASNLHLLFTLMTGGYGTFLLVRYTLVTTLGAAARFDPIRPGSPLIWLSAAVAGGMYAFASNKLFYIALGQFNIASNHWIPFAVLFLLRSHQQPRSLKNPLMAAFFLTCQAWSELTYASFLVIFIGLYWLYLLARVAKSSSASNVDREPLLRWHIRNAAILVAGTVLGLAPILAYMLPDLLTDGDFFVEGSGFAESFSADLLGFIIPTMHHPLFGDIITQTNIGQPGSVTGFDKGQHIYLGGTLLSLLVIALAAFRRLSAVRFWLVAAAVFFLLCLGPTIIVNGQSTGIPGPFVILQELPFFRGNRYPSRYSVMLLLSLSVLAGYALVWIGTFLNKRGHDRQQWDKMEDWRTGGLEDRAIKKDSPPSLQPSVLPIFHSSAAILLIAALFLFEHLSVPIPQSDMRRPEVYNTILADEKPATVLDIPFAWRNSFRIVGALTTQFMFGQFYQTAHQRPLLQGNTSRNPDLKFQYFARAPVINSLLALETGQVLPASRWAVDKTLAVEVLRFFNIRYLVVRPYEYVRFDGANNVTVNQEAAVPYIEQVLPVEKIYDQAKTRLYRVTANLEPAAELRIETTSRLAPLYFGEGWGWWSPSLPIAAQREHVRLMLPFEGGASQLTLRLRLPEVVAAEARQVSLSLNGWQSPPQTFDHAWRDVRFSLPAETVQPGLNDVYLNFDAVTRLPIIDFTQAPLDVTAISGGEEVGGFSRLYVNGYDLSPNARGYNLVAIQPGLGLQQASFDTHDDPQAGANLARSLAALSNSHSLVALAVGDEASRRLGAEAVSTLQTVGAISDLRGCFRCSHALIIDFSETPPALVESFSPFQPAGVTTNLGLTEPSLAAILDVIQLKFQAD